MGFFRYILFILFLALFIKLLISYVEKLSISLNDKIIKSQIEIEQWQPHQQSERGCESVDLRAGADKGRGRLWRRAVRVDHAGGLGCKRGCRSAGIQEGGSKLYPALTGSAPCQARIRERAI